MKRTPAQKLLISLAAGAVLLIVCVVAAAVSPRSERAAPTPRPTLGPTQTPAPTAPPRGFISRATWSGAWPFSVDSGTLQCFLRNGGADKEVILKTNDDYFAVNGIAKGSGRWSDIAAIRSPADADLSDVLAAGLALCP